MSILRLSQTPSNTPSNTPSYSPTTTQCPTFTPTPSITPSPTCVIESIIVAANQVSGTEPNKNWALSYSYDGLNWSPSTNGSLFSAGTFTGKFDIATDGDLWITVGGSNNRLGYSYDGITWSANTSVNTLADSLLGIASNGNMWIACGSKNNRGIILYSNDGFSWNNIVSSGATGQNTFYDAAWNGNMWLVGGNIGAGTTGATGVIQYSYNGLNWSSSTNADIIFNGQVRGFASNGLRWVAAGGGNIDIGYSDDGITWSGSSSGQTIISYHAIWDGGKFIVGGQRGSGSLTSFATILYSYNGVNWFSGNGANNIFTICSSIIYNGSYYVAGGTNLDPGSPPRIYGYSTDGINWSPSSGNTSGVFSFAGQGIASIPEPYLIPGIYDCGGAPIPTPSTTATQTQTPSQTNTPTITPTKTNTPTPSSTIGTTPTNTPSQTATLTPTTTPTLTSCPETNNCMAITVTGATEEFFPSIEYNNCYGTLIGEAFTTNGTRYRCVQFVMGVPQILSYTGMEEPTIFGGNCNSFECPGGVVPLTPTPTPTITQTSTPSATIVATATQTPSQTATLTPTTTPTLTVCPDSNVCMALTITGATEEFFPSIQYNNCFGTLINEVFTTNGTRYRCIQYLGGVPQIFSYTGMEDPTIFGGNCNTFECPGGVVPLTPTPTPTLTQTNTPSNTTTQTSTPSATIGSTPTNTPSQTNTPTPSETAPITSAIIDISNSSLDIAITEVYVNAILTSVVGGSMPNLTGNGTNLSTTQVGVYEITIFYSTGVSGQNISLTDSDGVSYCQNTLTGSNSMFFSGVKVGFPNVIINATDGTCS